MTCVVSPAAAGQGRCARGLVAMAVFEAVGRFRVGGQTLGEEAGGGDIALLFVAEMGILVPLGSVRRLLFTPEDGGQPAIEFDPPTALSHPLSRRIAPILASGAQFVPTLKGDESLGKLPLSPKRVAEVTVTLGMIGHQVDGPAKGGQCLVDATHVNQ